MKSKHSSRNFFIILSFGIIAAILTTFILKNISAEPTVEQPQIEEDKKDERSGTEVKAQFCQGNFTTEWGPLMLINANFTVDTDWIAERKTELVDLAELYGVQEYNQWNGIPYLDAEAAPHLNDLLNAYAAENPGHTLGTLSCFRSVGTNCGRMCAPTGVSDHHTGYTCDLIDAVYGTALDTDSNHPEREWLHANSYKFGFIDRFIEEWAGGSMDEPMNVDENGTTGFYENWHFRYVGIEAATEIATGKYNNGNYDSLEHYLKSSGRLTNLLAPNQNCK